MKNIPLNAIKNPQVGISLRITVVRVIVAAKEPRKTERTLKTITDRLIGVLTLKTSLSQKTRISGCMEATEQKIRYNRA